MKCSEKNFHEFKMVIRETIDQSVPYSLNACLAIVGRKNLSKIANKHSLSINDLITFYKATLS